MCWEISMYSDLSYLHQIEFIIFNNETQLRKVQIKKIIVTYIYERLFYVSYLNKIDRCGVGYDIP